LFSEVKDSPETDDPSDKVEVIPDITSPEVENVPAVTPLEDSSGAHETLTSPDDSSDNTEPSSEAMESVTSSEPIDSKSPEQVDTKQQESNDPAK